MGLLEKRIEAGLQSKIVVIDSYADIQNFYGASLTSSQTLPLTDEEILVPEHVQMLTEAFRRESLVEVPEIRIPQEKPWIAMNQYNTKGKRKHR